MESTTSERLRPNSTTPLLEESRQGHTRSKVNETDSLVREMNPLLEDYGNDMQNSINQSELPQALSEDTEMDSIIPHFPQNSPTPYKYDPDERKSNFDLDLLKDHDDLNINDESQLDGPIKDMAQGGSSQLPEMGCWSEGGNEAENKSLQGHPEIETENFDVHARNEGTLWSMREKAPHNETDILQRETVTPSLLDGDCLVDLDIQPHKTFDLDLQPINMVDLDLQASKSFDLDLNPVNNDLDPKLCTNDLDPKLCTNDLDLKQDVMFDNVKSIENTIGGKDGEIFPDSNEYECLFKHPENKHLMEHMLEANKEHLDEHQECSPLKEHLDGKTTAMLHDDCHDNHIGNTTLGEQHIDNAKINSREYTNEHAGVLPSEYLDNATLSQECAYGHTGVLPREHQDNATLSQECAYGHTGVLPREHQDNATLSQECAYGHTGVLPREHQDNAILGQERIHGHIGVLPREHQDNAILGQERIHGHIGVLPSEHQDNATLGQERIHGHIGVLPREHQDNATLGQECTYGHIGVLPKEHQDNATLGQERIHGHIGVLPSEHLNTATSGTTFCEHSDGIFKVMPLGDQPLKATFLPKSASDPFQVSPCRKSLNNECQSQLHPGAKSTSEPLFGWQEDASLGLSPGEQRTSLEDLLDKGLPGRSMGGSGLSSGEQRLRTSQRTSLEDLLDKGPARRSMGGLASTRNNQDSNLFLGEQLNRDLAEKSMVNQRSKENYKEPKLPLGGNLIGDLEGSSVVDMGTLGNSVNRKLPLGENFIGDLGVENLRSIENREKPKLVLEANLTGDLKGMSVVDHGCNENREEPKLALGENLIGDLKGMSGLDLRSVENREEPKLALEENLTGDLKGMSGLDLRSVENREETKLALEENLTGDLKGMSGLDLRSVENREETKLPPGEKLNGSLAGKSGVKVGSLENHLGPQFYLGEQLNENPAGKPRVDPGSNENSEEPKLSFAEFLNEYHEGKHNLDGESGVKSEESKRLVEQEGKLQKHLCHSSSYIENSVVDNSATRGQHVEVNIFSPDSETPLLRHIPSVTIELANDDPDEINVIPESEEDDDDDGNNQRKNKRSFLHPGSWDFWIKSPREKGYSFGGKREEEKGRVEDRESEEECSADPQGIGHSKFKYITTLVSLVP